MRGITLTYLSVAVATDVIKNLFLYIPNSNKKHKEGGNRAKRQNCYYTIKYIVILANTANASDEIITLIANY